MNKSNLGRNKIIRDLWLYKSQAILVILSVTVAVAAFGMINTGQIALEQLVTEIYFRFEPAHAVITVQGVDEELIEELESLSGVAHVEARRRFFAKIRSDSGEWLPLMLFAIPDLADMQVSQLDWLGKEPFSPPTGGVIFDHQIDLLTPLAVGQDALIHTVAGDEVTVETAGFVNEIILPTIHFTLIGIGFVSQETATQLGEPALFNELHIVTDVSNNDQAAIESRITTVIEEIESNGHMVFGSDLPEPGIYPRIGLLNSVMVILKALGLLILILSVIVVGNLIAALMVQQKTQIAILKSLGTTRGQIVRIYLNQVLIIGTIALLLAIPLGLAGAYGLAIGILNDLDFPFVPFGLPPITLVWQIILSYLVPFLAMLGPVIGSSHVTIREALGDTQAEMLGGWAKLVQQGSLLMRGALRNAFRRQGRLILTFSILSIGGAIFIAVLGLRDALFVDFNTFLARENYDVAVDFAQPYPRERLMELALAASGVESAEGWLFGLASRVYDDGTFSSAVPIIAVPADTQLAQPLLTQGEWFSEDDEPSIILSEEAIARMGLDASSVGTSAETFTIRLGNLKKTVYQPGKMGVNFDPLGFIRYQDLASAFSTGGQATRLVVQTTYHDFAFQSQVEAALLDTFENEGILVLNSTAQEKLRNAALSVANSVSAILLSGVLITVLVGGIGLASTLGISVLERTRQIGILRSIGTTNNMLAKMVLTEGLVMSLLSVPFAVLLSVPINRTIAQSLGATFIGQPLTYVFSLSSLLLWIAIIVAITLLASISPVRRAMRLTIREAIAYTG